MTRFVVDLGSVTLSEAKKNSIAAGIQALVISQLAEAEAPVSRFVGLIPPGWRGYILREELGALEQASRDIAGFAGHSERAG